MSGERSNGVDANNIKVSYLIPSYNHLKYIKSAIDSVLTQGYKNIELIVADDCSTDGSIEFLEQYANEKKFRLIRNEKNIGASANSRMLLAEATGDYICFLASDDMIMPDKIEKQLQFMLDRDLDAVYGPIIPMNYDEISRTSKATFSAKVFNSDKLLHKIYRTGKGAGLVQSGMFRAEIIKKVSFLEGYKSDDFLLQIRLLQNGGKVGYLNKPYTYYRIHDTNSHADPIYCVEELEGPVIRDFIPAKYQGHLLARSYFEATVKFLKMDNSDMALAMYKKGISFGFDSEYFVRICYNVLRLFCKRLFSKR